ncbi:Alpha/beta hydrolase family protein [Paenibacillus sp. 1_12]|uniref:alpha/beta hydrolase n=1 Tax=Paenibacillus sp. 1_12 TaxID=1566278 RepID=UPI0008F291F5|nr:alpha/beta fold hydrolase [Paenibacillus sp. 1_12]SFK94580.1 Alpha/beta hydrolase family protein [Paenibacillus sp. 1_12]
MDKPSMFQDAFTLEAGHLETGEKLTIRGEVRVVPDRPTPSPVLLICHGFKSFKDWGFFPYIATRFAEQGYYVITFNFSCNGVNEADFDELERFAVNTFSREQQDLEFILQALLADKLPLADCADKESIHLWGHSKGGGTAIIFAAEHPQVKSVLTWNGIGSTDLFDDTFKKQLEENGIAYVANARTKQEMPIKAVFYEDLMQNKERFDIVKQLAGLTIPVQQIQGDQDSPRLMQGFKQMRVGDAKHFVVTIAGGTHTFGAVHPFKETTPQLEQAIQASLQFLPLG